LKVNSVKIGFPDRKHGQHRVLIEDFDLEVLPGEVVAVLGKSGCGKSSLLRTIAGFQQPLSGTIEVLGGRADEQYGSGRLQFLHQVPVIWDHLTVVRNIEVALRLLGEEMSPEEIKKHLEDFSLTADIEKLGARISPGARARLALARVMCKLPQLLLLDEPFASVDSINRSDLSRRLMDCVQNKEVSLVWITHDIAEALHYASNIVVLRENKPHTFYENEPMTQGFDENALSPTKLMLRDQIRKDLSGEDNR
jgi:ABC-type nitrate/sulfonate/bicarbonate transport system ATPase subunit